jgi:SAM-dependent methyltransferase
VNDKRPLGVMSGQYALDRASRPHLAFRSALRARVAVEAFSKRMPDASTVHILDLGAAEGLTLARMRTLLECPGTSMGVEASDELLEQGLSSVELVKGDVMDLPIAITADYFHLCTALAVLEHLPFPERAVAGAFRSLRPGGVLVVSCPHPGWDRLASRLHLMDDESHQQHLSLQGLSKLLVDTGFVAVEAQRFMFAPVALLPYFGLKVDDALANRIDGSLRSYRALDWGFVNQLIIAEKPASR